MSRYIDQSRADEILTEWNGPAAALNADDRTARTLGAIVYHVEELARKHQQCRRKDCYICHHLTGMVSSYAAYQQAEQAATAQRLTEHPYDIACPHCAAEPHQMCLWHGTNDRWMIACEARWQAPRPEAQP